MCRRDARYVAIWLKKVGHRQAVAETERELVFQPFRPGTRFMVRFEAQS